MFDPVVEGDSSFIQWLRGRHPVLVRKHDDLPVKAFEHTGYAAKTKAADFQWYGAQSLDAQREVLEKILGDVLDYTSKIKATLMHQTEDDSNLHVAPEPQNQED